MSKSWNKKGKESKRKIRTKNIRKFLIVCEGAKTEPNYFKSFPIDDKKLKIIIIGEGRNTDSLVEETIKLKEKAKKEHEPYNQVWCVFDRDSFPAQNFNRAIQLSKSNGIKVAYSNEAFEIWYLLHFEYFINAMSRTEYQKRLELLTGHTYKKNSKKMYSELLEKQQNAIKNSTKLLSEYKPVEPVENNPSTTVFKLAEELNKRLKK